MKWPIARGRISHPIIRELSDLMLSLLYPLNDEKVVTKYQSTIATYLEAKEVLFFPFARTGLYSILKTLDLPAGSKVLMPTITIKPILDVVLSLNLEPVLVDTDLQTGCWDQDSLKSAIKKSPSVALVTYLFGVVPNLNQILPILQEKKLIIIEDFSQAFGAQFNGKFLGTLGDFGICSTSSTKTFDTYGGAIVLANNLSSFPELHKSQLELTRARRKTLVAKILKNLFRNFATNKIIFGIFTFPVILLSNSREKSRVGKYTGDRSLQPIQKLPDSWFEAPCAFQAKVGLRELTLQLKKDKRRIEIARRYNEALNLVGPRGDSSGHSVYWQYINVESQAVSFRNHLNRNGIDCATTSLVRLTKLPEYEINLSLPNTDSLFETGVYLPCYHQLTLSEQSRIIQAVLSFDEK